MDLDLLVDRPIPAALDPSVRSARERRYPAGGRSFRQIREKVYTEKIHRNPIEGFEWITVSIGVKTLIVDENTDISTEIAQADTALYQAKNTGRNRTQIFKD